MPQKYWSAKRERQYEQIKQSALEDGKKEKVAKIAAATVYKVRGQQGEARESSSTLAQDPSPSRRGGLRPHSTGQSRTRAQRQRGIAGRSSMNKSQLEAALQR